MVGRPLLPKGVPENTTIERQCPRTMEDREAEVLREELGTHQVAEPLLDSAYHFAGSYVDANELVEFHEYGIPRLGSGADGADKPGYSQFDNAFSPTWTGLDDLCILRGVEHDAEQAHVGVATPGSNAGNEGWCKDEPRIRTSLEVAASETGMASSITSFTPQAGVHPARDTPFRNLFPDAASARNFRKGATRFDRKPYRPPDTDTTIIRIKKDRQRCVEKIYNAMLRSDAAKDNPNSIAMRRWVHGQYYKSDQVEAFAHKVFDCLIEQVEEGFRGWHHNDYALDERKSDVDDKWVDCAGRFASIIRGLEEEKTICEDVMNSECQIRMFVNAPKAYAQRKLANRIGNSKRGRGPKKESTAERDFAKAPPSKTRKLNTRSSARTRITTPSATDREDSAAATQKQPSPEPWIRQTQRYSSDTLSPYLHGPTRGLHAPDMLRSAVDRSESSNQRRKTEHATLPLSPPQPHGLHPFETSLPSHNPSPYISPPMMARCDSNPTLEGHKVPWHGDTYPAWNANGNIDPTLYLPVSQAGNDQVFPQSWTNQSSSSLEAVPLVTNDRAFVEERHPAHTDVFATRPHDHSVVDFKGFWEEADIMLQLPSPTLPEQDRHATL